MGLAALLLSDMGLIDAEDKDVDNAVLINNFITANNLQEKEAKEIQYYIEFFRRNKIPQNHIEEVLRDAKDIHLGMPDALEE